MKNQSGNVILRTIPNTVQYHYQWWKSSALENYPLICFPIMGRRYGILYIMSMASRGHKPYRYTPVIPKEHPSFQISYILYNQNEKAVKDIGRQEITVNCDDFKTTDLCKKPKGFESNFKKSNLLYLP